MRHSLAASCAAALLVPLLGGCAPEGPLVLESVGSPEAQILVVPALVDAIGLPDSNPPVTTMTADGRMQVVFHLQNRTADPRRIRYRATFYDAAGTPVDDQLPQLTFLGEYAIRAVTVAASSRAAKTVKVQVSPAN